MVGDLQRRFRGQKNPHKPLSLKIPNVECDSTFGQVFEINVENREHRILIHRKKVIEIR